MGAWRWRIGERSVFRLADFVAQTLFLEILDNFVVDCLRFLEEEIFCLNCAARLSAFGSYCRGTWRQSTKPEKG
jgi:hypothetical protein